VPLTVCTSSTSAEAQGLSTGQTMAATMVRLKSTPSSGWGVVMTRCARCQSVQASGVRIRVCSGARPAICSGSERRVRLW